MTRKEIEKGLGAVANRWFGDNGLAYRTMPNERSFEGDAVSYLHSQGVVIKVDRELPETNDTRWGKEVQEDMLRAGYVFTAPLEVVNEGR